jgi:hypothetical protein
METALTARLYIRICFACLAVWLSTNAYSETLSPRVCEAHYDILIDGIIVGEARQSRGTGLSPTPSVLRIDEISKFTIKGDWGDWNLSTTSALEFTPDGIETFDHKISENKTRFRVRGEIQGNDLWASAHQVMTAQEKKTQEEDELLLQTASGFVPYLETGLQVLGLFESGEEAEGELLIPLKDFDATLRGLPLFLKRKDFGAREQKLRLLDTENLEVKRYTVKLLGEEELNLAGRTFHCRIVRIKAPKRDIRYWIAEDEISAFLVKEEGDDAGVVYEILLGSYYPNIGK